MRVFAASSCRKNLTLSIFLIRLTFRLDSRLKSEPIETEQLTGAAVEDKAEVMDTCRIFQLGGHCTVRSPAARFRDFAFPQNLPVWTAKTYFNRAALRMGTGKMQGNQAVCGKVSDIRKHEAALLPEATYFEATLRTFFFCAMGG